MSTHNINLTDYNYHLPHHLIANQPVYPRDQSRLLIYNTQKNTVELDRFINLDYYLPSKSFLVLNDTKVIPSRISLFKANQAKVGVLFLVNDIKQKDGYLLVKILVDKKVKVGESLFFPDKSSVRLIGQTKNVFNCQSRLSREELFLLLKKYGKMPIPLYIKNTPLKENTLRQAYQTIFASVQGSAAAPTASLHFTKRVFFRLNKKNIPQYFLTLHIGLGTFAPLSPENLLQKKLHREYYSVGNNQWQQINRLKQEGNSLIAVGTTVVRTLETIGLTNQLNGATSIFILPPFTFSYVNSLITNFHLPQTSLMLLVEAFLQFKKAKKSLIELYEIAIKHSFRFYSFGDAMLII